MKRTPKNILRHEIIGLRARIVESSNPYQVGIEGVIIDETMRTILFETERGKKRVLKDQVKLLIWLPSGTRIIVEGKELVGRPEDRLKKKLRFW